MSEVRIILKEDIIEKPLVCVIVLNYNGRDHLGYCLPSLTATDYPNYQIIVIDNASSDSSADMVPILCPGAKLIKSPTNLGWSRGNNLGIKAALEMGAEYVVLANNDIQVDPHWLGAAVDISESDPRIGVVGFQILEPGPGSPDRDDCFEYAKATWDRLKLSYPKYVGGMAMFVRAELFERIGLIDEGFFAYGEENDFQIRARKADYQIVATNVPLWHFGQGAFRKIPRRAAILQTRNNIRLLIKHGSLIDLFLSGIKHIRKRILAPKTDQSLSVVEQRLRPFNTIDNIVILIRGLIWNLWMLPATLHRRRADNRRAMIARHTRVVSRI